MRFVNFLKKGEEGVKKILGIFRTELDVAMGLSGCAEIGHINPALVVKKEFYSKL